jgi:hypothetical protein
MVLMMLVLVLVLLIGFPCGAKLLHQISKLRTQGTFSGRCVLGDFISGSRKLSIASGRIADGLRPPPS